MTFSLTQAAKAAIRSTNVEPIMVLCIDGIDTKYGSAEISEYIRIGDPDLYIDNYLGDPWVIGGVRTASDQFVAISFQSGTTTRFTQQLQPDKGLGTSVAQLQVALVDFKEQISRLISPGFDVDDLLGKNVKVLIGFRNLAFPEDYTTVFRGIVEDISSAAGLITLSMSSVDQKKRQLIFDAPTTTLTSSISSVGTVSTINAADTTGFYQRILGPDGNYDSTLETFIRIGQEFFKYTGLTATTFTGVTRNASPLDYGQEAHDSDDDIEQVIRLNGNGIDLALKLMLSGWNGPFITGEPITNFNRVGTITEVANAIYFDALNVEEEYGLTVGDYVTTTGASNGANNVTLKQISEIVQTNNGSYIVISGVSFVLEDATSGTISFRSQYDTLPFGMRMRPADVDVAEHRRLYNLFLSGFTFDFRITEPKDGKEFIEQQIYQPMTAFSIPRNARASLGYHIAPLPTATVPTLDQSAIINPQRLVLKRSLSRNFINYIEYQFELDILENKYLKTQTAQDTTSVENYNVGKRPLKIQSEGMRVSTGGPANITSASNRFLNRYKKGAEYLDGVQVMFEDGFPLEIGDLIILDTENLKVTDTKEGNRSGDFRIFQIINKSFDIKNGQISINIVDTKFDLAARYGLISPSSLVKSSSTTEIVLSPSFSTAAFGTNEGRKWSRYTTPFNIRVRSPDGVTRNAVREVDRVSGNIIILASALPFTPQANDIVEFPHYNDLTTQQKLIYVAMRDTDPFDDGENRYKMI